MPNVRIFRLALLAVVTNLISFVALISAGDEKSNTFSTEAEAKYLANLRQVTFGLPRAGEGYFSPKGDWIVYQAYPIGNGCLHHSLCDDLVTVNNDDFVQAWRPKLIQTLLQLDAIHACGTL